MADVEMTEATTTKMYTNPAGRIQRRTSLSDYTFNVNEIEKCLTKDGSQLTKKQKHILTDLRKLDRDGDGDISLIEILALEEDAERAQKSVGRLKKNCMRHCGRYNILPWLYYVHGHSSN